MQALVELRVPGEAISDVDFSSLVKALGGFGGAEETDAQTGVISHVAWFKAGADSQLVRARIAAAALLAGVSADNIQFQELGDDWETAWQKDWQAMPIGERLWVRPSFCSPSPPGRIDIVLDPGMAFGTGMHPTTRLCLAVMESICAHEMPGSLLDMGTGSGVLAIAAAKLGVAHVLALDNDPVAVDVCKKNAIINSVSIRSRLGDQPPDDIYDLVVANILAGPLIEMAPKLSRCAGSRLLLSGLLHSHLEEVGRVYAREGLSVEHEKEDGEWGALLFSK